MNKADLADPELSAKWQKYLEAKTGIPVILTNTSSSKIFLI